MLEDALRTKRQEEEEEVKKKPLNWKSNNIDLYVNENMAAANEIKTVVEKMKENLRRQRPFWTRGRAALLKRWESATVDDFEQLQKVTLKERYDVIKKGADSVSVSEVF